MRKNRRKALGQHFLTDKNILTKIVKVIDPQPSDFIIEIGAGKGALTTLLAQKKARVIAIERDKAFIRCLNKQSFSHLTVLEADILKVRLDDFTQTEKAKIVGNLPYSISTPILFKVLEEKNCVSFCAFLLQKEVAQRVCAQPGSKKYAPLSILFQNEFLPRWHFLVSPSAFSPPPQVDSALISLSSRTRPLVPLENPQHFQEFLKGAFRSRRKKLLNNLKNMKFSVSETRKALLACGIPEQFRPEQVPLSQFAALYHELLSSSSAQNRDTEPL